MVDRVVRGRGAKWYAGGARVVRGWRHRAYVSVTRAVRGGDAYRVAEVYELDRTSMPVAACPFHADIPFGPSMPAFI